MRALLWSQSHWGLKNAVYKYIMLHYPLRAGYGTDWNFIRETIFFFLHCFNSGGFISWQRSADAHGGCWALREGYCENTTGLLLALCLRSLSTEATWGWGEGEAGLAVEEFSLQQCRRQCCCQALCRSGSAESLPAVTGPGLMDPCSRGLCSPGRGSWSFGVRRGLGGCSG